VTITGPSPCRCATLKTNAPQRFDHLVAALLALAVVPVHMAGLLEIAKPHAFRDMVGVVQWAIGVVEQHRPNTPMPETADQRQETRIGPKAAGGVCGTGARSNTRTSERLLTLASRASS